MCNDPCIHAACCSYRAILCIYYVYSCMRSYRHPHACIQGAILKCLCFHTSRVGALEQCHCALHLRALKTGHVLAKKPAMLQPLELHEWNMPAC